MRSLFHFPLPCTTTLAVTVSYSNRPTAARNVPSPASCTHAPPAPLPSVAFRRPPAPPVPRLPRSGPRPTVTRSQGARHAAPPSLPRAAARSHRAPSPEYRPAAACTASPASRPPRAAIRIPLCRHRADPALIAPHHDHRAPPPSYTCRASPPETRHAVPVPMHLATCAPHPSRQPRGPTASRKQAEQRKQLNAGIKIGSPNGDPIEELFGLRSVCPTPYSPYTKRTNLRFPTWITAPDRDSGATL